MILPWLTVGLMCLTHPRDAKQILLDSRAFGVDLGQAAVAWLVASVAGTLLSALVACASFFVFGIDAPGVLIVCFVSGISFFVSLALYGIFYLFAVEKVTLWHDSLMAVLLLVVVLVVLLLGE